MCTKIKQFELSSKAFLHVSWRNIGDKKVLKFVKQKYGVAALTFVWLVEISICHSNAG